jgi:nucleotide-binding universal stress UspA family protein
MPQPIFQKILAADDGSPDGERAANVAVRIAAKVKSEVILLGVVEPPNIQTGGEGLPIDDPATIRRTMEQRFERFLRLGRSLGIVMLVEIVEGNPTEQILRRAKIEHADLIVLGRRNLSGVRRLFEGSTSEAVLKEANCSVMIAR